jgi:DNA polymerase-3 subunit alpha
MKMSNVEIPLYVYYHPAYILRNQNLNWQKDLDELSEIMFGKLEQHGEQLYKEAGIKAYERARSLESIKKTSDKLGYEILGVHSEYSIMKYGGRLDDELIYMAENGAKVIGISDINSTSSYFKIKDAIEIFNKSRTNNDEKIKVLYGVELRFNNDINLVLYAKNIDGYKMINRLVSEANTNYEHFDSGIIDSRDDLKDVITIIKPSEHYKVETEDEYRRICGLTNAYLGLIPSNQVKNKVVFNRLKLLFNLPTTLLIDNYYTAYKDYELLVVITAVREHSRFADSDDRLRKNYNDRYLKSIEEIKSIIGEDNFNEAIKNNKSISDSINFDIPSYHNLLPDISNFDFSKYGVEQVKEEFLLERATAEKKDLNLTKKEVMFELLVRKNNEKKIKENIERYAKMNKKSIIEVSGIYDNRIKHELETIFARKFIDYFLIVYDIYEYARAEGMIISAGRGSVGGSLVAYCLGITQVDPIINGLLFERFINEARSELPDIDCDFPASHRTEIIKYLKEKYGINRVISCGTFLSYKEKSILNDVAKVLNIPKYVTDDIANHIIKRSSGDARSGHEIEQAFEFFSELNKYKVQYPKFFDIVKRLEGQKKTIGMHASGITLLNDDYWNYFAVFKSNKGSVACYEYPELERNGITKFDVLGLSTLDVIKEVVDNNEIENVNYENPNGDDYSKSDKRVYELFHNGYTAGLFEVQTPAMTRIGQNIVYSFIDIVALNAIVRPAPIRYGMPTKYRLFKETGELASYGEIADRIFKENGFNRFGNLLLFQEQIMLLFNHVAGFYSVDSNQAVKAISKSKGITTFYQQYGKRFIDGAIKNGLSQNDAEKLFNDIFMFGSFSFNLSHSTLYGHTIYYTAWLKANYPLSYYASALNHSAKDERIHIISEAKINGIKIDGVNPNISDRYDFIPDYENKKIIVPLKTIKYLSAKKMEQLIAGRPYASIDDLIQRLKPARRLEESLRLYIYNVDNLSAEDVIKRAGVVETIALNDYKDEIIKYLENMYHEKMWTLKELWKAIKAKKVLSGVVPVILEKKPRFGNQGDWLKDQTKPTQKQIDDNPRTYSFLKKYEWFSRWCKIASKDLEGQDLYTNVYPDVYKNCAATLEKLKDRQFVLLNIKFGRDITSRTEALNVRLVGVESNKQILS